MLMRLRHPNVVLFQGLCITGKQATVGSVGLRVIGPLAPAATSCAPLLLNHLSLPLLSLCHPQCRPLPKPACFAPPALPPLFFLTTHGLFSFPPPAQQRSMACC